MGIVQLMLPGMIMALLLMFDVPAKVVADPIEVLGRYAGNVFTVHAYAPIGQDESTSDSDGEPKWCRQVGTAFLIDNSHLITTNHVLRDAETVQVVFPSGEKHDVRILGSRVRGIINILRLDDAVAGEVPDMLPLGEVRVGQDVLFMKMNDSALDPVMGTVILFREDDGTIIVNVSGDPGTSGTPVFHEDGRLLGFLAFQVDTGDSIPPDSAEMTSYVVIPAEPAEIIARSIINGAEENCGWLGIASGVVAGKKPGSGGLVVKEVMPGSPAEQAGLMVGDSLVSFNGELIGSPASLIDAISRTSVGDMVEVTVVRNGTGMSKQIVLSAYPSD